MTVSDEAVEAAASKAAEVYETLRSYGASAPEAILAALDEFKAAPHMLSAPEGVSEAEKMLRECAANKEAHWSMDGSAGACVDVPVDELQAVLAALSSERERAERAERERDGYRKHLTECEQIAGKALGYPWFMDDQDNFPGATEADGVCVGEHVGDTIVAELAAIAQAAKDDALVWKVFAAEHGGARRAAEAKVKAAGEIIAPFAAVARHDIGDDETDGDKFQPLHDPKYARADILTVGHLRAALRWTETQGEGE